MLWIESPQPKPCCQILLIHQQTRMCYILSNHQERDSAGFKVAGNVEVRLSWTANFIFSHVSLFSLSISLPLSLFCSDINILLVANGANVDWYFHYKSPQSHAQLYLWFQMSCKFWEHLTPVPQAYIRILTRWRQHFRLRNSSCTVYQVKPEHRPLETQQSVGQSRHNTL